MCAKASVAGATAAAAIDEGADTTSAVASAIAGSSTATGAAACFGAWPANGSENDDTVCTGGASNLSPAPASVAPSFSACFLSEATSSHALVAETISSSAAASIFP